MVFYRVLGILFVGAAFWGVLITKPPVPPPTIAVVPLFSLGALMLYLDFRLQPSAALNFLAVASLVSTTVVLAVFIAQATFTRDSVAVLAVSAIALCCAGPAAIHRLRDPMPNILRDELRATDIVELNGVQFSAVTFVETAPGPVKIFVQSCVNADRELRFGVTVEANSGARIDDRTEAVLLGGGTVGVVELDVPFPEGARGGIRVHIRPEFSGGSAKRLRRWRAPPYLGRMPTWGVAFTTVLSQIAPVESMWGGGIEFTMTVAAGSTLLAHSRTRWRQLWTPAG